MNSGPAQVTADQHDALARLSHDPGEVGRSRGLAVARRWAGDLQDLGGTVQPDQRCGTPCGDLVLVTSEVVEDCRDPRASQCRHHRRSVQSRTTG